VRRSGEPAPRPCGLRVHRGGRGEGRLSRLKREANPSPSPSPPHHHITARRGRFLSYPKARAKGPEPTSDMSTRQHATR
jgi:hypothetical protein